MRLRMPKSLPVRTAILSALLTTSWMASSSCQERTEEKKSSTTTPTEAATTSTPSPPKPRPVQRFVPLPEFAGMPLLYGVPRPFLALDTASGKLCRTWDFSWPNPSETQKSIQDLPTCETLSFEDSAANSTDPLGILPKKPAKNAR